MVYTSNKTVLKRPTGDLVNTYRLSKEQLQFYKENGYLIIKKLIALPILNMYRQRFIDACNDRSLSQQFSVVKDRSLCKPDAKPEEYINKMQELLYDEVFSTYSENPQILNVVAQLIGDDITAFNCMLINKPPGTSEHAPHQDIMYFACRPAWKIVGVWTAIDPAHKDNGCLYMIPGSHKREEIYEHVPISTSGFYVRLADADTRASENKRVDLEMEPGDTVFFSPLIIHGSRPNVTKSYRKCMTCHYLNSNCKIIDLTGTFQEHVADAIEAEFRRLGCNLSYVELIKIKSKRITGAKSNL